MNKKDSKRDEKIPGDQIPQTNSYPLKTTQSRQCHRGLQSNSVTFTKISNAIKIVPKYKKKRKTFKQCLQSQYNFAPKPENHKT